MDRDPKQYFSSQFARNSYPNNFQGQGDQNLSNSTQFDYYHFEAPINQSQDRMIYSQRDEVYRYNEYRQEEPVSRSLYADSQEPWANYRDIDPQHQNFSGQRNFDSAIREDNEGFVEVKSKRSNKKRNPGASDLKPWMMEIFSNISEKVIADAIAKFKGDINQICEYLAEEGEKVSSPAKAEAKEFNMFTYKTKPCKAKEKCLNPYCHYYHFLGERRRPPNTYPYSPELCSQYMNCPHQDLCRKAHNPNEVLYHPQVFVTQPCPLPKVGDLCIEGSRCHFKHSSGNSSLLEEINRLKIADENKKRELGRVLGDLSSKKKEKDEMSVKIKCLYCKEKIREVMRIQCGHALCGVCVQDVVCKVCGKEGIVVPINLNGIVF
ncbi:unnamed protein product [Blepharisma stoltei]|uniref:C3H1-type domain-containing protein n=1 Tax=Blepharisma stoltei TaxID=1481888 RepID=A0AAU9JRF7_9CILI|nr:unnamed protein product [Blepharisma stoltei]